MGVFIIYYNNLYKTNNSIISSCMIFYLLYSYFNMQIKEAYRFIRVGTFFLLNVSLFFQVNKICFLHNWLLHFFFFFFVVMFIIIWLKSNIVHSFRSFLVLCNDYLWELFKSQQSSKRQLKNIISAEDLFNEKN